MHGNCKLCKAVHAVSGKAAFTVPGIYSQLMLQCDIFCEISPYKLTIMIAVMFWSATIVYANLTDSSCSLFLNPLVGDILHERV